ncbi:hypothetical protein DAI22_10g086100 [Oryza sativa Japonica Group]|nr:hypothetical protein DAI22_10g086100 [Oryza sativa Japonica Group]
MRKLRPSAQSLLLVIVLVFLVVLAMPTALLGLGAGRRVLGDSSKAQSPGMHGFNCNLC